MQNLPHLNHLNICVQVLDLVLQDMLQKRDIQQKHVVPILLLFLQELANFQTLELHLYTLYHPHKMNLLDMHYTSRITDDQMWHHQKLCSKIVVYYNHQQHAKVVQLNSKHCVFVLLKLYGDGHIKLVSTMLGNNWYRCYQD